MKKAGIITHYNVHNHGAMLQLYGLSQELAKLGYDAKALQYRKNYDFMGGANAEKKYNFSIRSISTYFGYLLENGLKRTWYNYQKIRNLSQFRKDNRLIGDYYSVAEDLDAVVIGSDEIFSIEAGPNPWYYGIGVPCKKQISYAASFGPTTLKMIEEHNLDSFIKAGMDNITMIAVRDQNSASIVEHYTGNKPEIVCDPVLLHDFPNQINEKVKESFGKEVRDKYCIVYSYDYNMNDTATVDAIKNYAAKQGWKVYSIAYYHGWCDKNIQVSPLDVFKWFMNAEMVFTDTFHGSVLSLATGAQFFSMIRGNGNKLAFLLQQYGVSDRIVKDFSGIAALAENKIDYVKVNKTIKELRQLSMNYLENALR